MGRPQACTPTPNLHSSDLSFISSLPLVRWLGALLRRLISQDLRPLAALRRHAMSPAVYRASGDK